MSTIARVLTAAALLACAAGTEAAGTAVVLLDWTIDVPSRWTQQPPESPMRLAQFVAMPGENPVQMVVFYFGPAGGGPPQANIQRWESQFSTPQGGAVRARVREGLTKAGPVTWVELHGNYARGVGMGPQGEPKPDQTLLAAIVTTPRGNLTFQLFGPKRSVATQRKAFEAAVQGLRCTRAAGC